MARLVAMDRSPIWTARVTIGAAVAAAICAPVAVWFMGLDPFWSAAATLAVVPVGAFLASLTFEDDPEFDAPLREAPRGVRLVMATMERSLAACDRLARPSAVRRLRAFLIAEREDRLARSTSVRRMRTLLIAELHNRGVYPAGQAEEDAMVALFGPDALIILHTSDDNPVTAAVIARCLDAVERLGPNSSMTR